MEPWVLLGSESRRVSPREPRIQRDFSLQTADLADPHLNLNSEQRTHIACARPSARLRDECHEALEGLADLTRVFSQSHAPFLDLLRDSRDSVGPAARMVSRHPEQAGRNPMAQKAITD